MLWPFLFLSNVLPYGFNYLYAEDSNLFHHLRTLFWAQDIHNQTFSLVFLHGLFNDSSYKIVLIIFPPKSGSLPLFPTSVSGTPPLQSHQTKAVHPWISRLYLTLLFPILYNPLSSSTNCPSKYVSILLSSCQLHTPSHLAIICYPSSCDSLSTDPRAYTLVSSKSTLHGNLLKVNISSLSCLKLLMVSHLSD